MDNYAVRKVRGQERFRIIQLATGKVVGTSDSRRKANQSAHIRERYEKNKENQS